MADAGRVLGAGDMNHCSALLICSAKCEKRPDSDGSSTTADHGKQTSGKQTRVKRGIRQTRKKDGEIIPPDEWAKGDLKNMRRLMEMKSIAVHRVESVEDDEEGDDSGDGNGGGKDKDGKVPWLNYKEQRKDGDFALGKADILATINEFFRQRDKTFFVLYYTGHGDEEGSWVFPITKKVDSGGDKDQGERSERVAQATAATRGGEVVVENAGITVALHEESGSTTPSIGPRVSPAVQEKDVQAQTHEVNQGQREIETPSKNIAALQAKSMKEKPPKNKKFNDHLTFEEVVELWDENKRKREDGDHCRLLMVLDCCCAGRWVQKVNGEKGAWAGNGGDKKAVEFAKRNDICIQAACHPSESCSVSTNQRGSVFTKAFVAAQSKRLTEKCILTFFDHFLVLNVVSIASSPKDNFNPLRSAHAPFGGFQVFDSFDDMRT